MARQVTLKGSPLELDGPELKAGDKAPDVRLKKSLKDDYRIGEGTGQVRLISVVPSLDTPICALQTKRFNEEAARLSGVDIYTVSMDLPFAQKRWCGAAGVERVTTLSDHREADFAQKWGLLVKELRLIARAVYVVDRQGVIRHAQLVREIASEPDYASVMTAVRDLL